MGRWCIDFALSLDFAGIEHRFVCRAIVLGLLAAHLVGKIKKFFVHPGMFGQIGPINGQGHFARVGNFLYNRKVALMTDDYSKYSWSGKVKFQIFISSAFSEKKFRDLAYLTILKIGHFPIAMERDTSSTNYIESAINKSLDDSQIVIFILGSKYGEADPNDDDSKSYTEKEYDYAISSGKMVLVFLQDEKEINKERLNLRQSDNEYLNNHKLRSFHRKIKGHNRLNSRWLRQDDVEFALNVCVALGRVTCGLENGAPKEGWVNVKEAKLSDILLPSITNELRREIVEKVNRFERLDERCAQHIDEKKAIGRTFCNVFDKFINRSDSLLFIESGSTTAYVSQVLGEQIKSARGYYPEKRIVTNNYLAFVHLWLRNGILCEVFPSGPAQEPYGGVYGSLSKYNQDRERDPSYDGDGLNTEEIEKINNLKDQFIELSGDRNDGNSDKKRRVLMVGAISGVQMSDNYNFSNLDENVVLTGNNIRELKGFHVGNYFNMLFKRCMYETGYPLIICIHAEKIDLPITIGKCHFVFDKNFSWEQFTTDYPLAFCIGFPTSEREKVIAKFIPLKFDPMKSTVAPGDHQALIFTNERFRSHFPDIFVSDQHSRENSFGI